MDDTAQTTFAGLRPYLFSVAYRMLGSVADAEDVVQDAFLRWQRSGDVDDPKAYLSKVVTRLCIDHLRSARVRRETYVGPWLPEPLPTDHGGDAAAAAEELETLSTAFLVVLETLSPVERAVFLLRETFGYEYDEVAQIVGKTPDNCRQIAHRAKRHIEARRPRFDVDRQKQNELLRAFFDAARRGNLEDLTQILGDDVVLWSDGGGKAAAARRPVEGKLAVARFLIGIAAKAPKNARLREAEVNGEPAVVVVVDDKPFLVAAIDVADGKIRWIRFVLNPDKLTALRPR